MKSVMLNELISLQQHLYLSIVSVCTATSIDLRAISIEAEKVLDRLYLAQIENLTPSTQALLEDIREFSHLLQHLIKLRHRIVESEYLQ